MINPVDVTGNPGEPSVLSPATRASSPVLSSATRFPHRCCRRETGFHTGDVTGTSVILAGAVAGNANTLADAATDMLQLVTGVGNSVKLGPEFEDHQR